MTDPNSKKDIQTVAHRGEDKLDHDLLILYHTSLRNMGLIVSLSFGLLALHNNNPTKIFKNFFLFLAGITIIMSSFIGILTILYIKKQLNTIDHKFSVLHKFIHIIHTFLIVDLGLAFYILYKLIN